MENAEEILHFLEEFTKRKPKSIPQELNDYLAFVARTGDPVYQWSLVKSLFKEKLLNVITDFYETTPGLDIPPYPNVDPFNYDIMKNSLLERLDSFTAAPFTVQRICELLTYPRKQYNRIDKFMRAVEKNILVVSTREPGPQRQAELENGDPLEPMVNGSDNNSEYNVDVEMEDMSWKENAELQQSREPQPSSSDAHISVDDIEVRLQAKQEAPMGDSQEKPITQYESVTPPEPNVTEESTTEVKPTEQIPVESKPTPAEDIPKPEDIPSTSETGETPKMDTETPETIEPSVSTPLVIPEITVDDAEMTEQKLIKQASLESDNDEKPVEPIEQSPESIPQETVTPEVKDPLPEVQQPQTLDDSSSDSNKEETIDPKLIYEESTSSDDISSSSDIAEGNSNSPTPDNQPISVTEKVNVPETVPEVPTQVEKTLEEPKVVVEEAKPAEEPVIDEPQASIRDENYSITDVQSELPQPPAEPCVSLEKPPEVVKEPVTMETDGKPEEPKPEVPLTESVLAKES